MKNKKISAKNYVILGVIILITIIMTFYILNWYKQYNDTKISTPVITSTLREVKYSDLDEVLRERDFLIVYTCTTTESRCRKFENKFSKYISSNNLNEDIVYFNLGFNSDLDNNLSKVYQKYKSSDLRKQVYKYPTLLVFSEGKIVDVLSTNKTTISISSIRSFLEGYGL